MKCRFSRYNLGITLGASGVIWSLIFFIKEQLNNAADDGVKPKREPSVEAMATYLVTAFTSALFVLAIVKKQHLFIFPWLILCVIVFLASCYWMFVLFILAASFSASNEMLFNIVLIGTGVIGTEIGIFLFSCCLYHEFRRENIEHFSRVPVSQSASEYV